MNLPNKLTLLRICLIPVFVILMLSQVSNFFLISCIIFIIASITDFLDGKIARKYNLVTDFGKFMDPLADKLLVTAALISLVELQLVPAWAAIVIIAREFAVSGLRTIAASEGLVIAASWWGKIKTVIQIIAIVLLLLQVNIINSPGIKELVAGSSILRNFFIYVPDIFLYLAVAITIISGVDYFRKNKNVINTYK